MIELLWDFDDCCSNIQVSVTLLEPLLAATHRRVFPPGFSQDVTPD